MFCLLSGRRSGSRTAWLYGRCCQVQEQGRGDEERIEQGWSGGVERRGQQDGAAVQKEVDREGGGGVGREEGESGLQRGPEDDGCLGEKRKVSLSVAILFRGASEKVEGVRGSDCCCGRHMVDLGDVATVQVGDEVFLQDLVARVHN